jgi:hypothetical protein
MGFGDLQVGTLDRITRIETDVELILIQREIGGLPHAQRRR